MKKFAVCFILLTTMNTAWSGRAKMSGIHRTSAGERTQYVPLPRMVTTARISDQTTRESRSRSNRVRRNLCNCVTTLAGSLLLCASAQHLFTKSVQLVQLYSNKTA